ncbi:hypothetical protein MTO96_051225 [Rhipicephalus appendiculatus]
MGRPRRHYSPDVLLKRLFEFIAVVIGKKVHPFPKEIRLISIMMRVTGERTDDRRTPGIYARGSTPAVLSNLPTCPKVSSHLDALSPCAAVASGWITLVL